MPAVCTTSCAGPSPTSRHGSGWATAPWKCWISRSSVTPIASAIQARLDTKPDTTDPA
jgi:hypothetical protein